MGARRSRKRIMAQVQVLVLVQVQVQVLVLVLVLQTDRAKVAASATSATERHPVSRHIGRWDQPPRKCPSSMVTDAPIMANGDMGAAVCDNAGIHGVVFFMGKMDFWTQSHGARATYTTPRHLATHVAAGHVALAVTPARAQAESSGWNCTLFNCSCVGMAEYYGVWPTVGFGCAPPQAQAWWIAQPCHPGRPAVGCCKGPACALPGAFPCARGCSHYPPPPSPPPHPMPTPTVSGFKASQVLQTARVDVSRISAGLPTLNLSSIVAAEDNVLLTRLTVTQPAVLELSLGVGNPMDLPTVPGHTAAALTLDRAANAWLDNSAVLLECDAGMSPSYALRGVQLDPATGRVLFVNGSDPSRFVCPRVVPHPIYGPTTVGSTVCTPADDGPDAWKFDSGTGTLRRMSHSPQQPCVEMVYNTTKATNFVLFARNCNDSGTVDGGTGNSATANSAGSATYADMSNKFTVVSSSPLPEGGVAMLKAVHMSNETAPGGTSKKWVADGGCVALVKPNLNITMGIATWLFTDDDRPLPASSTPKSTPLLVSVNFTLLPGVAYVLKTSIQTNRPPAFGESAVERACSTIATSAAAALESSHAKWWERWWNMSAVDLGVNRQQLESFYYGAHYMLGSFSRVGGVTAGLLGPWSIQDPVGWFDDLTTDYVRRSLLPVALPLRRCDSCGSPPVLLWFTTLLLAHRPSFGYRHSFGSTPFFGSPPFFWITTILLRRRLPPR